MKVLVCGGRAFDSQATVNAVLDALHARGLVDEIIEGGAPGADALARQWAFNYAIPCRTFKADWTKYGNAAGGIRNQAMLDIGNPDIVIAFPGGRGTADTVRRATA